MENGKTIDRVIDINIRDEMKKSYIDYAMSVIVSRALPDVRDGLKPVHRRILYSMNEIGFTHDKQHRKSARIVGEVLGKYHPHGDQSVYNSMVRLAQDFSTRYLLVDGHGNFGSIDGDTAAAMRYTEARMSKIASELLRDIDKETVDFRPNFDETTKEPVVLPSRFPNLLVNGSTGIAVGMTTSIPPHNLGEIVDACVKVIDESDTTIEDLMDIVKGPDFPTGAEVLGIESIRSAYRTGRGTANIRSKAEIETLANGKSRIVVSEIPYLVNKSKMLESIADLVRAKSIDGITDLRDESNRNGIRVVIELRRDVNANVVLNKLYKHTTLQSTFSMIFIALVNNEPKVLNLREMIDEYIKHQKEVETRRVQYDLEKAKARAHIIEGLLIALQNIDEVIRIIRSAYDDAKEKLMERFDFSELQAQSILDMRLRRLQGLEYDKLDSEHKELLEKIKYFESVLADESLLMGIIKDYLIDIKNKFGDERRTRISLSGDDLEIEDLIEKKEMTITLTQRGYVKRVAQEVYSAQNRGGRGITGLSTREEDVVVDIFNASSHDYLLFFTTHGRLHKIKTYKIPEAGRTSKGIAVVNLLELGEGEKISAVIPVKEFTDDRFIIFTTKKGFINRMALSTIDSSRSKGIYVMKLSDDDEIVSTRISDGGNYIMITTKEGKAIRFEEESVKLTGRNTKGIRGIRITGEDAVVSTEIVREEDVIVLVTEKGYGKRTFVSEYRAQTRGGKGVITYNVTDKTGTVVDCKLVSDNDELMMINSDGILIRIRVSDISIIGRNTSGVKVMNVEDETTVVSIAKAIEIEDEEEEVESEN